MFFLILFFLLLFQVSFVFAESGGIVYFHEVQNKFVDFPDEPYTTSNIVTEHLVKASNTKEYWEKFRSDIRVDYLNTNSQDALKKQLTAQQLTYEDPLRRVIKDNEKVWGDIKTDSDKLRTNEVLERILKADNKNLGLVDLSKSKLSDSRFTQVDSKDVFSYGKEKAKIFTSDSNIKQLSFDDNVLLNKDENTKLTFNSGQFYSLEEVSSFSLTDPSGRIDKPFENIECSAKNPEVTFLKKDETFNITSVGGGEFVILDSSNNILMYGKNILPSKSGEIFFSNIPQDGIKRGYSQNTQILLYKDLNPVGIIYLPDSYKTYFVFDPARDSPAYNPLFDVTSDELLPLVSADSSGIIPNYNQYISISGHKMVYFGKKIGFSLLRPFDTIIGNGEYLNLLDSKTYIEFRGSDTYYSREIKENKFFINTLKNGRDNSNSFKILAGGTQGNYLVDYEKRVTVGEKTVPIPSSFEGFSGIRIPKSREAMWQKAAERV